MEDLRLLSYVVGVSELSQTGHARRLALLAAEELGFSTTQRGKVGIVATELASNLTKHSQGGEFVIQEIKQGSRRGLELLAIDAGPGFDELGKVMRDGYSTAGSPGTGLGAVKRLSHAFDAYSQSGSGTVFVSQVWAEDHAGAHPGGFEFGAVSVPFRGEKVNGDGWLVDQCGGGRCIVMMVDGLGHGEFAHVAAQAALEAYNNSNTKEPERLIEYAHGALHSTRGAAMAVALVDAGRQQVTYAAIGNIVGAIASPAGVRRLISHDGTVGHMVRKIHTFTYPWPEGALLIMHSDGLSANWNLERYPGLVTRHASVIAGVLYRDARRKNDDATVLVFREAS